jgi:hypothetical protein
MSSLDAVLAQYEKNKQSSSTPRMSQEERLKQYLSLALPKGVKSGERRIRILPTKDGGSPFQEVYFHNTQVQGKWMKIYDPGKDSTGKPTGERSPLNEVEEALRLAGDEQSKELARQYRSQKFYIVKVIDRDAEEDGVKFWRFKHNWKGDGPIDKIIPIWKNKGDITNPEEGRDLILILQAVPLPGGRGEYTTISSVMYEDPGKLSENETQAKEWLSNDSTWKDVYSQKPVEYLEAIAKGVEPVWDNELKKYTYNDPSNKTESTTTVGGSNSTFVDPQTNDKQDEDLPF